MPARAHLVLLTTLALSACNRGPDAAPPPPAEAVPPQPDATPEPQPPDDAEPVGRPDTPSDVAAVADALPPEENPRYYFKRPITEADLEGRSMMDLIMMRNWIFARAGQPFRKRWLRTRFIVQDWYKPAEQLDPTKLTDLDWKNAEFLSRYEASIPREELERRLAHWEAEWEADRKALAPYVNRGILRSRLGKASGRHASPLDDPSKLDKLIAVSDLDNLSRRDLRLLRNTVYARRGRVFKSEMLNVYFHNLDWYAPDESYTDAALTRIDKKNIRIIRSLEDSIGGPLAEHDHMLKDGWLLA